MKRYTALAVFLILVPGRGFGEGPYERATLKGLTRFFIVVESIDNTEAKNAGLTGDRLKADVELRLRQSHIKVADHAPGDYLYVNVNLMNNRSIWAYAIHVGLHQDVTIDRNKAQCSAETWSTGIMAVGSEGDIYSIVRRDVGDQVDNFINDYLAENQ